MAVTKVSPAIKTMVIDIIAAWSRVELGLIDLLAVFLKADFGVVCEMALALTGAEAFRKASAAAAKVALGKEELDLYESVTAMIRPAGKQRNKFVHNVWAFAADLPDSLLLIDPEVLATNSVAWNQFQSDAISRNTVAGLKERTALLDRLQLDRTRIEVYSQSEITQDLVETIHADVLVVMLGSALRKSDSKDATAHSWLSKEIHNWRNAKMMSEPKAPPPPRP